MSKLTGFRASVTFRYPIQTGDRRPLAFPQDTSSQFDAVFFLEASEPTPPGQAFDVEVRLMRPDYVGEWLRSGITFTVQDGARVAGQGVVLELLYEGQP